MTMMECPRESDVLDAVASEKWPHRVDAELADHVLSCAVCSDVLAVATAMRTEHEQMWQDAVLVALGVAGTAGWLAWSWIGQEPAAFDLMKVSAMASPLARSLVVAIFALAVVAPVVFYVVLSDE